MLQMLCFANHRPASARLQRITAGNGRRHRNSRSESVSRGAPAVSHIIV